MELVDRIEFAYPVSTMFEADSTWLFGREPTPRRMPDGSIVSLVYTGGKQEPARENVVTVIRSDDDGETWTKPQLLFRHPLRCTWGTEIFTEGERPFAVFQTFCYDTIYAELRAFMTFTDDCGRSWSDPVSIPGVPANFSVRQGKVLSDGSWIFPVYWFCNRTQWDTIHAPGNDFISGVIRSTDGGKSFSLHGAVETPGSAWEPEIAELDPGHLIMYVRYDHPAAVLWESESFDYGKSWTPARPTSIPNPGTKFVLYRIRGRHVLLNNVCTPDHPYRDVLELLRWLGGTADPQLDQSGRWYVAMRLFYPTFAKMPQACWPQATDFLARFLAAGRREQARPGPPLMDWQQDAPLIAAGISRAAGQDVRTLPYLHWWSFLAWFDAIGEGSFATVVAIRDKLRRGKRLENWELDFYRTHRAAVELRSPASPAQEAEKQRLLALLQ